MAVKCDHLPRTRSRHRRPSAPGAPSDRMRRRQRSARRTLQRRRGSRSQTCSSSRCRWRLSLTAAETPAAARGGAAPRRCHPAARWRVDDLGPWPQCLLCSQQVGHAALGAKDLSPKGLPSHTRIHWPWSFASPKLWLQVPVLKSVTLLSGDTRVPLTYKPPYAKVF